MVAYYQFIPDSELNISVEEIKQHVREHLSACVSPSDDPDEFAHEVVVSTDPFVRESDGANGILVRGNIARNAKANYLEDDFDPEDEVRSNPLSVSSIGDV